MSTMPPRTAYSPVSRTVALRKKPLISSHWMMPSIDTMLPGATASDCAATTAFAGTRCSAALTVVSRMAGFSRPMTRASRASTDMRRATMAALGEARS